MAPERRNDRSGVLCSDIGEKTLDLGVDEFVTDLPARLEHDAFGCVVLQARQVDQTNTVDVGH